MDNKALGNKITDSTENTNNNILSSSTDSSCSNKCCCKCEINTACSNKKECSGGCHSDSN